VTLLVTLNFALISQINYSASSQLGQEINLSSLSAMSTSATRNCSFNQLSNGS